MIVVSHRGPYRFVASDDGGFDALPGAGGVVSALGPLLTEPRDGAGERTTWIAAALSDDDRAASRAGAAQTLALDLRLLEIGPTLHRMHLDVVSNGVLWFLHHGLFDLIRRPRFDLRFRDAWEAYVAVNQTFATEAASVARDGDVVLVQDYQLSLVPGQLRAQRPDLRVLHFAHTPFCEPDGMRVLPTDIAEALCGSLASAPAGFHTRRWADAYEASARVTLGPDATIAPAFVASLGPDRVALEATADGEAARAAARALEEVVGDRMMVLRTDRVEPSKNIVRGFLAFDRLLEARPGLRSRVVFVAMLYPSRETMAEYLAYANEIEQVVARVNARWQTAHWTPIILDTRDDFARSIAAMQRYDVLFVNALKDGLNLVAKEGPLLNRRDGVVCLSPEAGAYEELRDAVVAVHPYDIEQSAVALDDALAMPLDERAARAARLRALVVRRTPADWLADLLMHADEQHSSPPRRGA